MEESSQDKMMKLMPAVQKAALLRKQGAKQVVGEPETMLSNLLTFLNKDMVFDPIAHTKGIDFAETALEVKRQAEAIKQGDLGYVETVLGSQTILLNQLFNRYVLLGLKNASPEGSAGLSMGLLQMALKMQEQTRKTVATLGNLKSPRQTAFIKQQVNHATNQQVLNGPQVNQKFEKNLLDSPNELMGGLAHETWMDTGTIKKAVRTNSRMEAMGEVDRSQDGGWES